jgi:hypothetical protein
MLAYVFTNWPLGDVDTGDYERGLKELHEAFGRHRSPGYVGSAIFRVTGVPWLARPRGYEDWYFLENSAALDPLLATALSEPLQEAHQRVTRMAGGGMGGLYRLRGGRGEVKGTRGVAWISKPAGLGYAEFHAMLAPLVSQQGATLWQRMLGLGPATEFCLWSAAEVALPQTLQRAGGEAELIWEG